MLKDKIVFITGQSGTFGTEMTKKLLKLGVKQVIGFDRDEKNQTNNKQMINDERVIRIIGDIRDYKAIDKVMRVYKPDYVFCAAAMKHIDKCQQTPDECRKTNIDGNINVINCAIANKVKKLIFLSTDKATNPSTIYGCSKLFVEMYCESVNSEDTEIIRTRYGNVLGSNGSVLQIWNYQKSQGQPLTVTNPDMTRFFMTIDEAIDLVLYALENGKNKDLWVYNNKSCTIKDLADCISTNQVISGLRCVEKTDEALLTVHELNHSELIEDKYYRVNKKIVNYYNFLVPLTSDNVKRFSKSELKRLIENG